MAISERMKRKSKETPIPADFGAMGAPLDKSHPFFFGFLATTGALTAFVLMRALASASQVFVLILVSLFLAAGLNPAVEAIRRRGLSRPVAVSIIFASVIVAVVAFAALIVPPLVEQGTHLVESAPSLLNELKANATFASINEQYGIIDTLQKKLASVTRDGSLLISAFGGVFGVGKTVISGVFTALTILILTLYFLTSLPQVTELGLRFVPTTRRPRVSLLTNAIIARIGSFIGSQIFISFLAAVFVATLSAVLGLPSPVAIGIIIFICGLVPLIGHFIGISIVTLIALTQSISVGVIAFAGYVIYVQIENYILTPRVMKKTLAVPGAVTIISALIGTSLLGLVGGLLAVPVAASVILILDEVVFPRAQER